MHNNKRYSGMLYYIESDCTLREIENEMRDRDTEIDRETEGKK